MSDNLAYLLFNVDDINTTIGISVDGRTLSDSRIFKTPKKFEEGLVAIVTTARELAAEEKISSVCGGVPGLLIQEKSVIYKSLILPEWERKPFAQELSIALGIKVILENNVALEGLGESEFGSGQDSSIISYVSLARQVNGVRIVERKIDKSHMGFDIGSQIINFDNTRNIKTLNDYVGTVGIEKRFGKNPYEIDDPVFWEEIVEPLSAGIANTQVHWSAEKIVIGGALAKKLSLARIEYAIKQHLLNYPSVPVVTKGTLGEIGSLWGALSLLNQKKGEQ